MGTGMSGRVKTEEFGADGGGDEVGGHGAQHVFHQMHDFGEVLDKGHFGFEHVKFTQMAGSFAPLGTEGRREGPDLPDGVGEGFEVQLGGYGEILGGFEEMVMEAGVRRGGGGGGGGGVGVDGEDFSGPFAVGGGDDWGVGLDKVFLGEESGQGGDEVGAETEAQGVGGDARAEMGDGAEEFRRLEFGLEGVEFGIVGAENVEGVDVQFVGLLGAV